MDRRLAEEKEDDRKYLLSLLPPTWLPIDIDASCETDGRVKSKTSGIETWS